MLVTLSALWKGLAKYESKLDLIMDLIQLKKKKVNKCF